MIGSARALFAAVVDYAGLFPPAALPMAEAMRRYALYRTGSHSWMLGRLVVPAARLEETQRTMLQAHERPVTDRWPVSAVLAAAPGARERQLDELLRAAESENRALEIAAVELAPVLPGDVAALAARVPRSFEVFFELPLDDRLDERLAAVAAAGAGAKVRTGGADATAFPSAEALAHFIAACARERVPFKATAGLHHPLRSTHSFGEPLAPLVEMHGFLNLAAAAALASSRATSTEEIAALLCETSAEAFRFENDGLGWRGRWLPLEALAASRRALFRSFGSCSFAEPVAGLGLETLFACAGSTSAVDR